MNEDQRAAFIISQAAAAQIEMESMKAANADRERRGEVQAYAENDFLALIDRYGLGSNCVVRWLNG